MLQVGDEVIVMSAAGHFHIVAVDGEILTIENDAGLRKQVHFAAVRRRPVKEPPSNGGAH